MTTPRETTEPTERSMPFAAGHDDQPLPEGHDAQENGQPQDAHEVVEAEETGGDDLPENEQDDDRARGDGELVRRKRTGGPRFRCEGWSSALPPRHFAAQPGHGADEKGDQDDCAAS